jgi:WD40 repeat protein
MFPSGFGSKKNQRKSEHILSSKSSTSNSSINDSNIATNDTNNNNNNNNTRNRTSGSKIGGVSSGIHMFTKCIKAGRKEEDFNETKLQQQQQQQQQQEEEEEAEVEEESDTDFGPQLPNVSNPSFQTAKYIVYDENKSDTVVDRVIHYEDLSDVEDTESNTVPYDEEIVHQFPITNVATLKGHKAAVSAVAIDPSGSRMITGSYDYSIKFWDFAGMNQSLQYFREREEVCGSYPINHISFSPNGELFAVAPDAAQAKIFDRDGFQLKIFKKGDQYLSDKSYTKGHTAAITGLKWHPVDKKTILTCSLDCTLRVWDVETCDEKQVNLLKTRTEKGTPAAITTCTYNLTGSLIGAGCLDGSIQLWQTGSPENPYFTQRPNYLVRNAHSSQTEISSLAFSRDGHLLASRSCDGTLKLWDIRSFRDPIHTIADLPNLYNQTDVTFSPDGRYYITGTSIENKEDKYSRLIFVDSKTNNIVKECHVENGSIIRLVWHPILNQIVTTLSNSHINLYYDNELSKKGILLSLAKAAKKKNIDDIPVANPVIITPYSLPMFKPEPSKKKQKEKARKNPIMSHKPAAAPSLAKGSGGKIGENLTHLILKNVGAVRHEDLQEDPREALLKYAEKAKTHARFVETAYQETQPVPIFDYSEYEQTSREREIQEKQDREDSAEHRFKRRKTE